MHKPGEPIARLLCRIYSPSHLNDIAREGLEEHCKNVKIEQTSACPAYLPCHCCEGAEKKTGAAGTEVTDIYGRELVTWKAPSGSEERMQLGAVFRPLEIVI